MDRFFGGNPGVVLIRLCILSVILGVLLTALGLDPRDIIDSFMRLLERVYNMGFEAIEWALRYFLLGAIIVFPVWLISRIFKFSARSQSASGSLKHRSGQSDA